MAKQTLTQAQIESLAQELVHGMTFGLDLPKATVTKPAASEDGVLANTHGINGMKLTPYRTEPVVDPDAWRGAAGMLYRKTN